MVDYLNIREFIKQGKSLTLYWDSEHYPKPIPYHPLSESEIEKAFDYPFNILKDEACKLLYYFIRTNPDSKDVRINPLELDLKEWKELIEIIHDMIIYQSTKDFQDEEYSLEDTRDIKDRDGFVLEILTASGYKDTIDEEKIEFFRNEPTRAKTGTSHMESELQTFGELIRSNSTSD